MQQPNGGGAGYRRPGDGRGPAVPPRKGIPDGAIVGVLATLLGTTTLVWLSTALGALVTHGHLPHPLPFGGTPTAIRNLATEPNRMAAAWPGTPPAQLPSPAAFWTTFFVLLALLIALALTVLTAWMRLRAARRMQQQEQRVPAQEPVREPVAVPLPRAERLPRTGAEAEPVTIHKTAGAPAPAVAPPDRVPASAPVPEAAPPFAFPAGMTALLVPDSGSAPYRRRLLQRAVGTATGPVLVVTDDLALWEARPPHRDARLYDPLRLVTALDDPDTRVRWAPHEHCDDPSVAAVRARALLAPTARGDGSTSSSSASHERSVQETAQTVLRCWLHAAALDGRPFRHIQRWASGSNRQEALGILRNADPHTAADGWDGELQTVLTHSTELRDSALRRISGALQSLSELQVQQACAPSATSSATDSLDVESVLRHRGTLYVLGRATETRIGSNGSAERSVMPLLSALVEDVVERGRRMAVRSSSGRLDPPLLCVLDNAPAVAPFPGLPELMARGGPLGLAGVAVFRSPEQARLRWDERAVHSLWTSADARALLGPLPGSGIDGLLRALGSGSAECESAAAGGALDKCELVLLADRKAAQRFRIEGSSAEGAPVRS
ncbi:type IV secretory system conjugative DNA transfer family protein [Streptacidiphilus carbonis]|uniref:type IV secretory system conjugative DNA transfer family protein n=1 Tax=Streptacidiphilus carbonis TaxID=105422 RepID=UPI000693765F|nr:type IV secretory system conjugative DNA transfer family protein [Streptacidiphilus carbonis]